MNQQRVEARNRERLAERGNDEVGAVPEHASEARELVLAPLGQPVLGAEVAVDQRVAGEQRAVRRCVENDVLGLHAPRQGFEEAADLHLRAVAPRELVGATPVPRVRERDADRQPETRDVSVERREEPLLLVAWNERIDEQNGVRRLEVRGADLAIAPVRMLRSPAPEARLQLLDPHGG